MIPYEQHASSQVRIPHNGVVIPELQLASGEEPLHPEALSLRLYKLGQIAGAHCAFTESAGGFGASVHFSQGVLAQMSISFHQDGNPTAKAIGTDRMGTAYYGLSRDVAEDGYFVLESVRREDRKYGALSFSRMVLHLGGQAVHATLHNGTGQPRPYKVGANQLAVLNTLNGLSQVLPAAEAMGGYAALTSTIGGKRSKHVDIYTLQGRQARQYKEHPACPFGDQPVFDDLERLMRDFTGNTTSLRHAITAYRQYMERHEVNFPLGLTPEDTEKLTASRYDIRLATPPKAPQPLTAIYRSREGIPQPAYREITDILAGLFPSDALAHHLLREAGNPLLAALPGRFRTVEAVRQALGAPIGEVLHRQRSHNTHTIRELHAKGIYTLDDLLGRPMSDEQFSRFKDDYTTELNVLSGAFVHPLLYLPHAAFVADVLEMDPLRMPIYANNPTGISHEQTLRWVVEKVISQVPEPYATVLTLRYLYQGTGTTPEHVRILMGYTGWREIQAMRRHALQYVRNTETQAGFTMMSALQRALGPGYAAFELAGRTKETAPAAPTRPHRRNPTL